MSERFEASEFFRHSLDRYRVMDPSFSPKSSWQKVASRQQIQRVNTSQFLFLALGSSDTLPYQQLRCRPIDNWPAVSVFRLRDDSYRLVRVAQRSRGKFGETFKPCEGVLAR